MKVKYKHLLIGILLDSIGLLSYAIPIIGESIDFIWAPLSAFIMLKMYRSKEAKAASIFSFFEEILPGTDLIPTFTFMWIYHYVYSNNTEHIKLKN